MAVPTKASQFTQQPTKNSNSLGSLAREKQWVNSINDNNGFMQYEMQNCWDSNRSECNENSLCGSQLMSTTTTEDSTTESILSCKQSNIGRRLQYSSPMPPQPQQQPQAQYPQMSQAMNQLLEKYRLSKYISKFEKEGVTIEKLCNYKLSQLDEMKDKIIGHKARIKRNNFDRMMRALQESLQEQQKANESNEENDIYEQEKKEVESRKYNEDNKSENEKISGRMLEERVRLMKCFEMNKRIGIDKNDNRKWYWLCELGKQHCWIEFDKAIQKILCDQFRKYINSSKNTSASVNFTLSWTNKKSKIVFDRTYFFHETILAAQYDSGASRKLVAFGCPDVNGFIHGMFVGHNNNNDNNNEDDNDSDYERSRFDHSNNNNNNNNNNNSHNHSNNNNNNNNDNSEDSNDGHITASSIDSDADTDQGNDC